MLLGTKGIYWEIKVAKTKQNTTLIINQLGKLLLESGNFCIKNSLTEESLCKDNNMKI
jgi:hypothetical protein